MLRGLRKASSNWLGKAVMAGVVGFLVISFAIWGIGDIFRGFGRSTAIKIGHTEIGIEIQQTFARIERRVANDDTVWHTASILLDQIGVRLDCGESRGVSQEGQELIVGQS